VLRFLFSFCDTKDDVTKAEPRDEELRVAFKKVRELANELDTPLRENLNLA
jgi:hypothetical protein